MEYEQRPLTDVLADFPPNAAIQEMVFKTLDHIEHEAMTGGKIMVSISGGSDSDIMLDLFERIGYPEGLVVYVWFDTGLEYDATKRHLRELEAKYGIQIKRFRPKITIAQAVKRTGLPFLSKDVTEKLGRLQKKRFPFWDTSLTMDAALVEYPRTKLGITWWFNARGHKKSNIENHFGLREYIQAYPPETLFSNDCCRYVKKNPAKVFTKTYGITLEVIGVRRAEGGVRASAYQTCFSEATDKKVAQFRPLFYLTDQDKQEYKDFCGVTYSDCYEVWGFKRTGCVCCPFGSTFEQELDIVKMYEPKLYAAACKIFGPSYEYTRKYRTFKEAYKREKRRHGQIDLFDNPDTILNGGDM